MDPRPSWVKGEIGPPLLDITIGRALDLAAAQWGDADAVVSVAQGVRWSWRELALKADAMAAGLLALGLERGDRIGIWSPNCAEWTLTQFAAARLGLILTTINPAYRTSELEFTLNKVGMKALVAAERFKTSDYVAMIEAAQAPMLEHRIQIGGARRRCRGPERCPPPIRPQAIHRRGSTQGAALRRSGSCAPAWGLAPPRSSPRSRWS